MNSAYGRWLLRGTAEPVIVEKHADLGCDRTACYSGRVWMYLMRFLAVRQE